MKKLIIDNVQLTMKRLFNNKGASMVVVTASMVTILGLTALVTDVGMTIYEKEKIENAVDASALAGMQEIEKDDQTVINTAKQYAQLNGIDPDKISVSITPDRKKVKVETTKEVKYYFSRIVGINEGEVDTDSNVKVAPLTSFKGVKPLTIADQVFEFNKQYTLKEDSGDGQSGNYGVLALGGNGSAVYRDNLKNGFQGSLSVGDIVFTETGNISGATKDGIDFLTSQDTTSTYDNIKKGSPRLIIIPIVNTLDLNGKKPINIVGFASFFLEGAVGKGGQTEIVGRFVKQVAAGDSSDTQKDYGLKGIKLTR